jgi:cytochrome c-type biogenesis protein CcmE
MMPRPRRKRIVTIVLVLAGMGVATGLILTAFEKNLMYFYSPSEVVAGAVPEGRAFRLGGLVVEGSVLRNPQSLGIWFTLTDLVEERVVYYEGILPDLFREGQGIIANGRINDTGLFVAEEVLAKHDENYMPPEVASALENAAAAEARRP